MKRFVLALISCLLLMTTVLAGEDWPLFRGNSLQNGVAAAKLPNKLKIRWKFTSKDSIEGAVAVVDGIVYAGSMDEHLYAIDLKKGEQKWKNQVGDDQSRTLGARWEGLCRRCRGNLLLR